MHFFSSLEHPLRQFLIFLWFFAPVVPFVYFESQLNQHEAAAVLQDCFVSLTVPSLLTC